MVVTAVFTGLNTLTASSMSRSDVTDGWQDLLVSVGLFPQTESPENCQLRTSTSQFLESQTRLPFIRGNFECFMVFTEAGPCALWNFSKHPTHCSSHRNMPHYSRLCLYVYYCLSQNGDGRECSLGSHSFVPFRSSIGASVRSH